MKTMRGAALGAVMVSDNAEYTLFELDARKAVFADPAVTGLDFRKVSPVRYTDTVESGAPFELVLGQSYDRDWQLELDGKAIPDEKHFAAGNVNGWQVDSTDRHDFDVYYKRQDIYAYSAVLSLATFAFDSGVLAIALAKRRDRIKRSLAEKNCVIRINISRLCDSMQAAVLSAIAGLGAQQEQDAIVLPSSEAKDVMALLEKALAGSDYVAAENMQEKGEIAVLRKGEIEQLGLYLCGYCALVFASELERNLHQRAHYFGFG
jgi:hypothetical protein